MATKQNYVKKMEVKNKQKIDAGIISERFPSVAGESDPHASHGKFFS